MEITHGSSGGSGGTPGGSDTEVQFNDDGAFGGDPGLTYDKTTNTLSVDTVTAFGDLALNGADGVSGDTPGGDVTISAGTPSGAGGIGQVYVKDGTVGGFSAILSTGSLAAERTFGFPNASGTIALTSDIPSALDLETDGVANGDQTLLNLTAGTNINLTDNGTGTVTIDATGTPLTLQTDGTPNGDQTLLNLVEGTNITLTDNGTGSVTIDAASSGAVWGAITGTLSSQTDLQTALDLKASNSFAIAMAVAL